MDDQLRQAQRALDIDPDKPDLIERLVVVARRSGSLGEGPEGDDGRELVSKRLSRFSIDRVTQIETALRAFSVPFRRTRLVEGRAEWQFKLAGVDCAARVSDPKDGDLSSLDVCFYGHEHSCVMSGISTRRLVDLLASPRTIPQVDGDFMSWSGWEAYRFVYGISMKLGVGDRHDGHEVLGAEFALEAETSETEASGARRPYYAPFHFKRRGLIFSIRWCYSGAYGEFDFSDDDRPLDLRVVSASRSDLPMPEAGMSYRSLIRDVAELRCIDTMERQFWTARDLVEAPSGNFHARLWIEPKDSGPRPRSETLKTPRELFEKLRDLFWPASARSHDSPLTQP